MASVEIHRRTRIVSLARDENIADHCGPGDIAIHPADDGWWTSFVSEDGQIDSYDEPFPSHQKAVWAAKAAAEYASS